MPTTEIFDDLDDSVEELNSWLAIYRRLVHTAPPSLLEIAQTALGAMNDVYTRRAGEQDQVGAELVGAARGRTTARDDFVAQKHSLRSSHGGDDGSGDGRSQLLPARRPEHHERCSDASLLITFLQNQTLARPLSPGQTTHVPGYSDQAARENNVRQAARTVVSTAIQLTSNRPTADTTEQGAALPRSYPLSSQCDLPSGRAGHLSTPVATSGPGYRARSPPQLWALAPRVLYCRPDAHSNAVIGRSGYRKSSTPQMENQRGNKRSLEVEDVEDDDVNEEHDDDERDREGLRPKRSRCSAERPSVCHPSSHVYMEVSRENDGRIHATNLASIPLAAPVPAVLALAPAASVVGPVPTPVAPAVQLVQPALVLVPPPCAAQAQPVSAHLSPVA